MKRKSSIERETNETKIKLKLALDGTGKHKISTSIPFFDHMLIQIAKHGLFDLEINAKGDTEIDDHHTVEDVGIVLGQAFKKALDKKIGITRYGFASIPLDEALAKVTLDISGRPFFVYNVELPTEKTGNFDVELVEEFFRAFATHSGITLHVTVEYGKNLHHILEASFKALGRALDQATKLDTRVQGVPSTKGSL